MRVGKSLLPAAQLRMGRPERLSERPIHKRGSKPKRKRLKPTRGIASLLYSTDVGRGLSFGGAGDRRRFFSQVSLAWYRCLPCLGVAFNRGITSTWQSLASVAWRSQPSCILDRTEREGPPRRWPFPPSGYRREWRQSRVPGRRLARGDLLDHGLDKGPAPGRLALIQALAHVLGVGGDGVHLPETGSSRASVYNEVDCANREVVRRSPGTRLGRRRTDRRRSSPQWRNWLSHPAFRFWDQRMMA